jgi:hypothetical protein
MTCDTSATEKIRHQPYIIKIVETYAPELPDIKELQVVDVLQLKKFNCHKLNQHLKIILQLNFAFFSYATNRHLRFFSMKKQQLTHLYV